MKLYSPEYDIYIDLDTFYQLYKNYIFWCNKHNEILQYTNKEVKQLIHENDIPESFITNLIYYNKLMKKF